MQLDINNNELCFLPLGGCGEIGMNLNLYGFDNAWLMVDCGVTFEGNNTVMADPTFIAERRDQLAGIIATHAHQDHIGAMIEIWELCRVPIYTTPFTAYILKRNFSERGIHGVQIVTVGSLETLDIGPFSVQWLPITHSTPETHALLIRTDVAVILHTADWKIDRGPVIGPAFDQTLFEKLGPVEAVVCDSTNATTPGVSVSEQDVQSGLQQIVQQATGRVVVSCFASNVARLQTLGNIAAACGRYIGVMGRSLNEMTEAAKACGYLDDRFLPIDIDDLGYLPANEVLAIASGSQGEPGAALGRLATDQHPCLNLEADDTVVMSARAIPGNEAEIEALTLQFRDRGIDVVLADEYQLPIHASGHAYQEEIGQLYDWVRPNIAIPVHGETEHMAQNAMIAAKAGVPTQLKGRNGDLFIISSDRGPTVKRQVISTGRVPRG